MFIWDKIYGISISMMEITRQTKAEEMPEWLTIKELAKVFPMGRSTLYRLIGEGKSPARKVGGRRFIPRSWVVQQVAES